MAEGCCRAAVESDGHAHDEGCNYLAGLREGREAGRREGYAEALLDNGLIGDGIELKEVRTEFEVWWHAGDDDDAIRMSEGKLPSLRRANEVGASRVGQYGIVRWTVHQREHRIFSDWSSWSGPWRKVEQDA